MKLGSPGVGGNDGAVTLMPAKGSASRADHWSHDSPPILVNDTSSGPPTPPPEIAEIYHKMGTSRGRAHKRNIQHSREVNNSYKQNINTCYIHNTYIQINRCIGIHIINTDIFYCECPPSAVMKALQKGKVKKRTKKEITFFIIIFFYIEDSLFHNKLFVKWFLK